MAAAGPGPARAGWSVECGLRRSAPHTVGTRRLSVLAWCLGFGWRGPRGRGVWGLAHPIAVIEVVAPAGAVGAATGARWRPVLDVSLFALAAALALLVWLLRAPPRRRPGR